MRIESIYCFNYTASNGYYDSIREFGQEEMTYMGLAFSTPKMSIQASPTEYKITKKISQEIREYAVAQIPFLKEISKDLAINSPKYLLLCYVDDSKRYFEYDESFYNYVFDLAKECKPTDNSLNRSHPFAIEDVPENYIFLTQNIANQNGLHVNNTQVKVSPKKKFSFKKLIGFLLILYIGLIAMGGIFEEKDSGLTPVTEPINGKILAGYEVSDGSEITVTASGSSSCVVKLKTTSGVSKIIFYVRAGETVTIGVPAEYLDVYFASGDTWYGMEHLFGEDTYYSKDDSTCNFKEYTWEYTLYPVSDGNFTQTPIDADEF